MRSKKDTIPYRFLENLITSFYILYNSSQYAHLVTRMHTNLCKGYQHQASE